MATEQKKKNKYWNMKVLNDSTAEITLYGSITGEGWFSESSSKAFQAELKSLGDVSSIDLYINSPGGDVFEGQAIHSMLQRTRKNQCLCGCAGREYRFCHCNGGGHHHDAK
ncbi:ATP-dependent Clp protease proteolytic subunit (plasmid) [Bacillus paralicheniformis]